MHFDRIEWRVIPNSATAAAALQAGEIDWYEQVQPDLVQLLRRNPDMEWARPIPPASTAFCASTTCICRSITLPSRRAVLMAVNQHDYMAAITGGDDSAFNGCKAVLPCGTPYGREIVDGGMNPQQSGEI